MQKHRAWDLQQGVKKKTQPISPTTFLSWHKVNLLQIARISVEATCMLSAMIHEIKVIKLATAEFQHVYCMNTFTFLHRYLPVMGDGPIKILQQVRFFPSKDEKCSVNGTIATHRP